MTLANFNTNFNWQYRMLKEAAECCGIVPVVPPTIKCYCYTISPGSGGGVCKIVYKNCEGLYEATTSSKTDPVYICAQEGSIVLDCPVGTTVVVTGGSVICTGIPGECIPPIVYCYWFGKIHDFQCSAFSPIGTDWLLNGSQYFAWNVLMQNPPYGTVGNAVQYTDPFSGCFGFSFSDYYFWTMVPSNILTLPDLTGNDSNGNLVLVTMFQGACAAKCYEGTLTSLSGNTIIYRIETAEVNAGEYSFFVDLADPAVNTNFTLSLGAYYPAPLNVTVTVVAPNEYTIRINGLYSTGSQVNVYLDDGISSTTLNEVPC